MSSAVLHSPYHHKPIILPSFRDAFQANVFFSDDELDDEPEPKVQYLELDLSSSDERVTYFNVSSERGLWQTDPLPYKARLLQRASMSAADDVQSPFRLAPILQSRQSEPALTSINSGKFLAREDSYDDNVLEDLPTASSPVIDRSQLSPLKIDDMAMVSDPEPSSPRSMRASYAPSSPLPPSSPPLSPMSMTFSDSPEEMRSVSPLSEHSDAIPDADVTLVDPMTESLDCAKMDSMPSPLLKLHTLSSIPATFGAETLEIPPFPSHGSDTPSTAFSEPSPQSPTTGPDSNSPHVTAASILTLVDPTSSDDLAVPSHPAPYSPASSLMLTTEQISSNATLGFQPTSLANDNQLLLSSPHLSPKLESMDIDDHVALQNTVTGKRKSHDSSSEDHPEDSRSRKKARTLSEDEVITPPADNSRSVNTDVAESTPDFSAFDAARVSSCDDASSPAISGNLSREDSPETRASPCASVTSQNRSISLPSDSRQFKNTEGMGRTGVEGVLHRKNIPRFSPPTCSKSSECKETTKHRISSSRSVSRKADGETSKAQKTARKASSTPESEASHMQKTNRKSLSASRHDGAPPCKEPPLLAQKTKQVVSSDDDEDQPTPALKKSTIKCRPKTKRKSSTLTNSDEENEEDLVDTKKSITKSISKKPVKRRPNPPSLDSDSSESDSDSTSSSPSNNKRQRAPPPPPPAPDVDPELLGLVIETLAVSRASSMPPSSLYRGLMSTRPALKEKKSEKEWMVILKDVLEAGLGGVFGRVESSGKDSADRPLEPQWFYNPEGDADQERAGLIRCMMPRPGKRTVTKQYKQYYYKPLHKVSRWAAEDEL